MKPLPAITNHFIEQANARARWLLDLNALHQAWNDAREINRDRRGAARKVRDLARDSRYFLTPDYSDKRPPVVLVLAESRLVTVYEPEATP